MLHAGLLRGAVEQKMRLENVDPALLDSIVDGSAAPPPAFAAASSAPAAVDDLPDDGRSAIATIQGMTPSVGRASYNHNRGSVPRQPVSAERATSAGTTATDEIATGVSPSPAAAASAGTTAGPRRSTSGRRSTHLREHSELARMLQRAEAHLNDLQLELVGVHEERRVLLRAAIKLISQILSPSTSAREVRGQPTKARADELQTRLHHMLSEFRNPGDLGDESIESSISFFQGLSQGISCGTSLSPTTGIGIGLQTARALHRATAWRPPDEI